jgi:hypothetical protein
MKIVPNTVVPPGFEYYYKPVKASHVDIYRILLMYDVTDPCLQHAIKKLLVAGGRKGGKDITRDVDEAMVALQRWQNIQNEDMVSITMGNDKA